MVVTGLIGGELYARHLSDNKVANAVQCEVQDKAAVSFGLMPPVFWQYLTGRYTSVSVQNAGNQIRGAKGMKVDIEIRDVRLQHTANSEGTIGALDASINWSSEGIKQSVQDAIPLLGGLVTNSATTDPGSGTIQLKGALGLGSVAFTPQVVNNTLELHIVSLTGLGAAVSEERVQTALDEFASKLTANYPLGIHPDSVQVTGAGVVSHFSTRNATIPSGDQDQCFAGL